MKALLGIIFVVALVVSGCGGADESYENYWTHRIEFGENYWQFRDYRSVNMVKYDFANWTADYCSPPSVNVLIGVFDFTWPCGQHDFGYRNYKQLESKFGHNYWEEGRRKTIDDHFLANMDLYCDNHNSLARGTCKGWASQYYLAVRNFAG